MVVQKKERKNVDLKGTWLLYDCCMVAIVLQNVKRSISLLGLSGKTWYLKEGQNNKSVWYPQLHRC